MGDLVWVRIFFPKPLELEIFSTTSNGARFFFSSIIRHERYFFQRRNFFPRYFIARFFPSKSV